MKRTIRQTIDSCYDCKYRLVSDVFEAIWCFYRKKGSYRLQGSKRKVSCGGKIPKWCPLTSNK